MSAQQAAAPDAARRRSGRGVLPSGVVAWLPLGVARQPPGRAGEQRAVGRQEVEGVRVDFRAPSCFVVMPFHRDMTASYERGVRPAVESLGLRCVRLDRSHFAGKISEQILREIRESYFVVADLTLARPNCYYEVGFAHAIGKPTILIARDPGQVHFDIRDFNCLAYSSPGALQRLLRDRIEGTVLYNAGSASDDDPRRAKFGRLAARKGRLLTAEIRPRARRLCDVTLAALRLPGSAPLSGPIRFYLHNEYPRTSETTRALNDRALLEIDAYGAFTVGASCDYGRTRLELDLATIPGGTPYFYSN